MEGVGTEGTFRPGAKQRRRRSAHDIARLGMLLALATALHTFEAQLPALPIPGAKLGLANIVSLLALFAFGFRDAVLLVILRQIAGSIVIGTFLTPAFFFGLAGSLLSVFVMAAIRLVWPTSGPVVVSLGGATAHNMGQLLVAWWLTGQVAVLLYLPYLLWFAVPAGALVGRLFELLLPYLRVSGVWRGTDARDVPPARRGVEWGVSAGIVALGLAVMLAGTGWPLSDAPVAAHAVVRVGGEETHRIPLDGHRVERIMPEMTLEVDEGRVRIAESECNHQVCVRTGWISSPNRSIVCVPYKTVITVEGEQAHSFDDIDAFTQ